MDISNFSNLDIIFIIFVILGTLADIWTTKVGWKGGCVESNPLYGKKPSDLLLYGLSALALGVYVWASSLPNTDHAWIFGLVYGLYRFKAAHHNYKLDCFKRGLKK
jgi:hypothetical protein